MKPNLSKEKTAYGTLIKAVFFINMFYIRKKLWAVKFGALFLFILHSFPQPFA